MNNPKDPGGATNKGITLRTFLKYFPHGTLAELKLITNAQAGAIYKPGYWTPVRGDELPAGLDLVCFDAAVNTSPIRSIEQLQEALGVTVDGGFGPETMAAVQAVTDLPGLLHSLSDIEKAFYESLPIFDIFGRGWINRVDARLAKALTMASPT